LRSLSYLDYLYPKANMVKKRTLACKKAGKYKPIKTKPIGQQRNK
ncbi:6488_t:CDS:1, partial [Racocetra fulgida]